METAEIYTGVDVPALSDKESAIIRTLLYFGVFNYPLTLTEIHENCQFIRCTQGEVETKVQEFCKKKLVNKFGDFYFITGNTSQIERRKSGNQRAANYFSKAQHYSRLISFFPFVEAVYISGSLAKGFVDEKGDIDYFIITRPNRLWLCRSLLIIFKKLFLLNSHKYFCLNYFIDSSTIEIPDQNIFTATELVFAIPMYNRDLCSKFERSNLWKHMYYPNKPLPDMQHIPTVNNGLLKTAMEHLLGKEFGEILDEKFFKLTLGHWKKKFPDFDESTFDLNMRSRKNVSKHHPSGFQQRVLLAQQQAIQAFEKQHQLSLSSIQ